MRVTVLASGSSGNATLVASGGRGVLLDAGLSAREILRRTAAAGCADVRIEAVLLTHEHVDHVRGARVLARQLGVPVIGTHGTLAAAASCLADVRHVERIGVRDRFAVAGMRVTAFATAHDAAEPCGYRFESTRGRCAVIATDTGTVTQDIAEALAGAHLVGIEANHDLDMLETGPYPPFLKRRIASDRGHLSNESAASALADTRWHGLAHVLALHISEQNNTPELAHHALARRLDGHGRVLLATVARNEIAGCEI